MNKIILWNAHSIHRKKSELDYLIYKENPGVIALCETWLKDKDNFKINNYDIIRKDRKNQIGGGLILGIRKDVQFKKLNLNDMYQHRIEILGVKVQYKEKWLNMILIYNPCNNIREEEFQYYYDQLQNPKLIIGDFNAHHPNWNTNNNKLNNVTGKSLVKLINQNNIILLTPKGQITRVDPITNKESTLDLVLGSPTINHFEITTGPHLASDHLPIIIKEDNYQINSINLERKWNFTEEGWQRYISELNKINVDIETIKILLELLKKREKKFSTTILKQ